VLVRDLIEPGDVVLLKGSRSVGLERVATSLMDAVGRETG
jgi:UDP-N-acetylmuramyl pentapeptide synthase